MTDTPISKKYRILNQNNEWDRISFWTKGSDVHYDNDISTAQDLALVNNMLRNKDYFIGDMVYEKTAKPYYIFECVVNGTTAATTPSGYSSVSAGEIVEDGDAQFRAYDIRPTTSDSGSSYITASSKTVDDVKNHVVDTDNEHFYFGNYGGNYGFFTSADRSASSFHLFRNDYLRFFSGEEKDPPSITIPPGETGTVLLLSTVRGFGEWEWEDVWFIEINHSPYMDPFAPKKFYVRYNFESLGGITQDGWIGSPATQGLELISVSKTNGNTYATFRNDTSESHWVSPYVIFGYEINERRLYG